MEWISVKDRLPEYDVEVLLCFDEPSFGIMGKEIATGCLATDNVKEGEFTFTSSVFSISKKALRVTHWMPLPEPPTE